MSSFAVAGGRWKDSCIRVLVIYPSALASSCDAKPKKLDLEPIESQLYEKRTYKVDERNS
jgi:hypothetical protein